MLLDARSAEVARNAADGDDERVIAEAAIWRDFAFVLIVGRGQVNALVGAIDADHLAIAISESVPMPLCLKGQFVASGIHAAGGDFVQQRLPDVRTCMVDKGDLGSAFAPELVAELRREFEPAGAAADDDDAVQLRSSGRNGLGCSEIHMGLMRSKSHPGTKYVIRRR